jgi:ubiquinone/menaquinone biosynthesis C-methylase UbiE
VRLLYKLSFIKLKNPKKLHLGCGSHILSGWTNIDIYNGDFRLDILKGLPFKNNSVDFIYHAHFIEHFTIEQNLRIFNECYRVLNENGILRILFGDLVKHCQIYLNNDTGTLYEYRDRGTIVFEPEKLKYSPLTEWLNRRFYDFGHKFIYDFKTIEAIAKKAGFTKIYLVEHDKSSFKDLVGIDYYPETEKLFSIVEIRK